MSVIAPTFFMMPAARTRGRRGKGQSIALDHGGELFCSVLSVSDVSN